MQKCIVILSTIVMCINAMEQQPSLQPLYTLPANSEIVNVAGKEDVIVVGLRNSLIQKFNREKNQDYSTTYFSGFPNTGYWPQALLLDKDTLMTADGNTLLWDINDNTRLSKIISPDTQPWGTPQARALAATQSGYYVGDNSGAIIYYDKQGRQIEQLNTDTPRCDCINKLVVDNEILAVNSLLNCIVLFDTRTNQKIFSFINDKGIFLPDNHTFLISHAYSNAALVFFRNSSMNKNFNTIKVLDSASGQVIKTFVGNDNNVGLYQSSLCVGNSNILISAEGITGQNATLNVPTVEQAREIKSHEAFTGNNIPTHINTWDFGSAQQVAHIPAHNGSITDLTDLDNGIIASGSSDKTVKLWSKESIIHENPTITTGTISQPSSTASYCSLQ